MPVHRKIAVILPIEYRGGTLNGAKLIASALHHGARQAGDQAQIILGHLDLPNVYSDDDFSDLPEGVQRRQFVWRTIDRKQAERAMQFSRRAGKLDFDRYQVPDDGMNSFYDCDLIVCVSDRLHLPMLPLYRYALVVYDYIQRYVGFLSSGRTEDYIRASRHAVRVLTTTEFTAKDAMQYAGISPELVKTLPPIIPQVKSLASKNGPRNYFVWPTNPGVHKNHQRSIEALAIYYHQHGGTEDCYVTGPNTDMLTVNDPSLEHLAGFRKLIKLDKVLAEKIKILGDVPQLQYQTVVRDAKFMFHSVIVDNGTFSVIEAAALGTPSVSSDYPAMRELCAAADVKPIWADAWSAEDMAAKLAEMSRNHDAHAKKTRVNKVKRYTPELLGAQYWQAIKQILDELPTNNETQPVTQASLSAKFLDQLKAKKDIEHDART